eukprot:jgi/Mesvir1/19931/Mv13199-RA.1
MACSAIYLSSLVNDSVVGCHAKTFIRPNRALVQPRHRRAQRLPWQGTKSVQASWFEGLNQQPRRKIRPTVAPPLRDPSQQAPNSDKEADASIQQPSSRVVIKVIGVGNGGCNAVDHMIRGGLSGIEFWAANADAAALEKSLATNRVLLGKHIAKGKGAGGDAVIGRATALEERTTLERMVQGADVVFLTAGLGGGTGTGAVPVIASVVRETGALAIAVVTEPFTFEGRKRAQMAMLGFKHLRDAVDTLVVIPCDRLLDFTEDKTPVEDAFGAADEVMRQGVQAVSDLILTPGLVNVDFADLKAVMTRAGCSMLGIGTGSGPKRAKEAARAALLSPLLDTVSRPLGVIYNVTGGADLTLHEVNEAAEIVYNLADPNASIIFGAVIDESFQGRIRITVIATGFNSARALAWQHQRLERQMNRGMPAERMTALPGTGASSGANLAGLTQPADGTDSSKMDLVSGAKIVPAIGENGARVRGWAVPDAAKGWDDVNGATGQGPKEWVAAMQGRLTGEPGADTPSLATGSKPQRSPEAVADGARDGGAAAAGPGGRGEPDKDSGGGGPGHWLSWGKAKLFAGGVKGVDGAAGEPRGPRRHAATTVPEFLRRGRNAEESKSARGPLRRPIIHRKPADNPNMRQEPPEPSQ